MFKLQKFFCWFAILCCHTVFAKPIEIIMWHAMAGPLGVEVNRLADQFNHAQSDYVLKPIYKGNYLETLTAYAAAYRGHMTPALVQVFEVGRGTMLYPKGVVKPAGKVLKEQGVAWEPSHLWPALNAYYARTGELEAFPFNVSLPVMYYNADRLQKLGIDAQHLPKTWQAYDLLFSRLAKAGDKCAYTTAYPGWIHIEAFLALQAHASNPTQLLKQHFKRLMRWHQTHLFAYAGRIDEATVLFTSGRCAFFSQSSGAFQSLAQVSSFKVGIAPLPVDSGIDNRAANVIGGGALWVSAGLSPQVEKGIAAFFAMMLRPEVQQAWYQRTGYLPILRQQSTDPLLDLVQSDWEQQGKMTKTSAQNRIRAMNDESIESFLSGMITLEQMMKQLLDSEEYADYRFGKNHGVEAKSYS